MATLAITEKNSHSVWLCSEAQLPATDHPPCPHGFVAPIEASVPNILHGAFLRLARRKRSPSEPAQTTGFKGTSLNYLINLNAIGPTALLAYPKNTSSKSKPPH